MPDLEKFVQHAIDICNDDRRGYDQPRRMSGVDIDCSELVRESLAYGGFSVPNWLWTGNMFSELPKRGWTWHQGVAGIKRGDILWKTGHTAVYIGGNRLAEASANEKGSASGGKPGDQTGREVRVRGNALDYPAWAGYFTFTGTDNEEDDVVTEQDKNDISQKAADAVWNKIVGGGKATVTVLTDIAAIAEDNRDNMAGKVWAADTNGVRACDRLAGIDGAANAVANALPTLQATIAAQGAAIETLSKSLGADPQTIAKAVQQAVADKLAALKITVE